MKAMVCELCGSNEIVKDGDYFVCQSCGTKYTTESAKKLLIEGTVNVSGSSVSIDASNKIKSLLSSAADYLEAEDYTQAEAKIEEAIGLDSASFEAWKLKTHVYGKSTPVNAFNPSTLLLAYKNTVKNAEESKREEVANEEISVVLDTYNAQLWKAKVAYYEAINNMDLGNMVEVCKKGHSLFLSYISLLELSYLSQSTCERIIDKYIEFLNMGVVDTSKGVNFEKECAGISNDDVLYSTLFERKMKLRYPSYSGRTYPVAKENKKKGSVDSGGGCYVATAVYGSYDCPEVWTLRRFRDYDLAETWYGRMFIRIYYAVSPTIVKWFGQTQWFISMLKPMLDRMVLSLKLKGYEDTPYHDKQWKK